MSQAGRDEVGATRILITNAYSARNRGDAAIILGMVESLRRTTAFRDADLRISSADHLHDACWYPLPTVPSFPSLKNGFSKIPAANQLFFLVVLLPASLLWAALWRLAKIDLPVPRRLRELMRAYADADLVLAAGGGYLYTTSTIRGSVVLVINIYCFYFGVLLGKPVAMYAQSIGPFAGSWQAGLVRRVLAKVILVQVREEESRRLLDGWDLSTPVCTVSDAAFLLEARPPGSLVESVASGAGPVVGMTVRKWFRDRDQQLDYEGTIASFVQWLTRERQASVVFLPQVTYAEGLDDDRVIAHRIAAAVEPNHRVRVIEDELSAAEVKWLCGRMDIFVGTRMHSNIFALSSGVPTVAIAYQPKTVGIMADLGLERWVAPIEGLSVDDLRQAFLDVAACSDEIRSTLEGAIPQLERGALEAGARIAEAFSIRNRRDNAAEPVR